MSNRTRLIGVFLTAIAFLTSNSRALEYYLDADHGYVDPTTDVVWWNCDEFALPPGTTIGSTPLAFDLFLSHSLTVGRYDLGPSGKGLVSFGFGGINPEVPVGSVIFDYLVWVSKDGTPLTSPVGYPFVNDTPSPMDSLYTGNWFTLGLEYNEIHVTFTSPVERSVASFRASATISAEVPDSSSTGLLILMGLSGIIAFARRKAGALT